MNFTTGTVARKNQIVALADSGDIYRVARRTGDEVYLLNGEDNSQHGPYTADEYAIQRPDVESWTVNGYTLTRTTDALCEVEWDIRYPNRDAVDIFGADFRFDGYRVNWAGCGSRTVGEALEYAKAITAAAEACAVFNEVRLGDKAAR